MVSFSLTLARLLKALYSSWEDPYFRSNLLLVIVVLISGTLFYSQIEGWSALDSLYFSVTTLATVGYGDLHPQTAFGKIFTILYIFVGIGLFISFFTRLTRSLLEIDREDAVEHTDPAKAAKDSETPKT
ncbi:MAG TPA: potassium channel family protein [Thiolinea sp.]|nr:potassium channel family protein [Thiolinea sp.]